MPKKWNNKRNNDNNSDFYCHDDRYGMGSGGGKSEGMKKHNRKVLFKTPYEKHECSKSKRALRIARLDDDTIMGREESYIIRRNVPKVMANGNLNSSKSLQSNMTWFKVIIPYGQKQSKEFILKSISDIISPRIIVPIMYKALEKEVIFYLDNEEDANLVHDCSNKIFVNDGFKLKILVRPGYPNMDLDHINDAMKDKIKIALGKRYIEANNALDLSNFHRDPEFVSDYFCALFRPLIMNTILDIVSQHIPNLMAINFNDNKLSDLRLLKSLNERFRNLKILYLGNNRIKEIYQLEAIKGLKLQELFLQGNPMCKRYTSRQNDYVCDIQGKFPTLQRLDGQEVKKPISFDLDEESKALPPSKMLFFVNEESKNIAMSFLVEYFRVFDSADRQNLMNAYHEQATLSMTVYSQSSRQKLNNYFQENRNLLRVTDTIKRHKLLKTGRIHVISHLVGLPKTQHIDQSFTMDICIATKEMIMLVVTGVFKEVGGKEDSLRYFNRTLVIVPEGGGFCICNEQLHISNATEAQERKFYNLAKPQPLIPAVPVPVAALSTEDMQRMAMTLSQQTKMNLDWSVKCLQECNWQYDNAVAAFQTCVKNGQIPPEAFNALK